MQEALAKLKEEEERAKREEEERIKRLEELEAKRQEEVLLVFISEWERRMEAHTCMLLTLKGDCSPVKGEPAAKEWLFLCVLESIVYEYLLLYRNAWSKKERKGRNKKKRRGKSD